MLHLLLHVLLHVVSVFNGWKVRKSLLDYSWVCGDWHLRLHIADVLRVLLLASRLLLRLARAFRTCLLHMKEQEIAILLCHVGTALQQVGHHAVYTAFYELEELSAKTYLPFASPLRTCSPHFLQVC
jgi:hypothetical protein